LTSSESGEHSIDLGNATLGGKRTA
jgi:hypothetical protein